MEGLVTRETACSTWLAQLINRHGVLQAIRGACHTSTCLHACMVAALHLTDAASFNRHGVRQTKLRLVSRQRTCAVTPKNLQDHDSGFFLTTAALLSAAICCCSARLPSLHGLHHAAGSTVFAFLSASQLENSALDFISLQWPHFHSPLKARTHVLQTRCAGVRQALSANAALPCMSPHLMHSFSSAGFVVHALHTRSSGVRHA